MKNTQTLPMGFQEEQFAPPVREDLLKRLRSQLDAMEISCSSNVTERIVGLEAALQSAAVRVEVNLKDTLGQDLADEIVMLLLEKAHSLREWRVSFSTNTG